MNEVAENPDSGKPDDPEIEELLNKSQAGNPIFGAAMEFITNQLGKKA